MSKNALSIALVGFGLFWSAAAFAQTEFLITFRGSCYQTNSSGNITNTPLTEQTLLQAAADATGIADLSSVALVYHVGGNSTFGDTIELVDSNGGTLFTLLGLFFGTDSSLGRAGLTNSALSEVREVDYVYTLNYFAYGVQNSHSVGAAFVTKRYQTAVNGGVTNVLTTIEGDRLQWLIYDPNGTSPTKICTGSFTTTRAYR